ncbi:MAG: SDR family NAD(P)-dependent oxidoreductase, partial [Flavisolibacter sp.]
MNAVITGASRGIGKELARIFALHGYDLYLNSKNETSLLQTIEELKTAFPDVEINGQAIDISKKEEARLFSEWVASSADTIDV